MRTSSRARAAAVVVALVAPAAAGTVALAMSQPASAGTAGTGPVSGARGLAPAGTRADGDLVPSDDSPEPGDTLALTGGLGDRKRPIVLAEFRGGQWRDLDQKQSRPNGSFVFRVVVPDREAVRYRAYAPPVTPSPTGSPDPSPGDIEGIIRDGADAPVPGVVVSIYRSDGDGGASSVYDDDATVRATSSDSGAFAFAFAFTDLEPGTYLRHGLGSGGGWRGD